MNADRTARYLAFCLLVEQLCTAFNASVISWWRTTQHNAAARGHPDSFHLEGLAADLVTDLPADQDALIKRARALGLQVAPKKHGVHIELDYRAPPPPRATASTS